jgi:hypothetical protein
MHAARPIPPTISEPLTWAAICERYPDEWVCLVEIDRIQPGRFAFRTARIVGHGKKRLDPLNMARSWWVHYPRIGHYHTRLSNHGVPRGAEMTEDGYHRLVGALAARRNATSCVTPTISEVLTWEEVSRRYPDEWVCLVEIDYVDPDLQLFHTARVVGHGKSRREPSDQASPWWEYYDEIAHYFTGWSASMLSIPPVRFKRIDIPKEVPVFYPVCDERLVPAQEGE